MKKAVGQVKNGPPGPGQDKDTVTTAQRVSEWLPAKLKRDNVSALMLFDRIAQQCCMCHVLLDISRQK